MHLSLLRSRIRHKFWTTAWSMLPKLQLEVSCLLSRYRCKIRMRARNRSDIRGELVTDPAALLFLFLCLQNSNQGQNKWTSTRANSFYFEIVLRWLFSSSGVCSARDCDVNAQCSSQGAKVSCVCKAGYEGDGRICVPKNPCSENNGGCPVNSTICVFKGPNKVRMPPEPGRERD